MLKKEFQELVTLGRALCRKLLLERDLINEILPRCGVTTEGAAVAPETGFCHQHLSTEITECAV